MSTPKLTAAEIEARELAEEAADDAWIAEHPGTDEILYADGDSIRLPKAEPLTADQQAAADAETERYAAHSEAMRRHMAE